MSCRYCDERKHLYDWACKRCRARDAARMPRKNMVEFETMCEDKEFLALVEEERETDAIRGDG